MTAGQWGGLQIRLTQPEVTSVLDTVGTVVEYTSTALDIGLNILQVVRTFVPSNLNVTRSLVNEFLALVRNLSADLRQIGLYAHLGDVHLMRSRATLSQLKGGYDAYERRMLTRLRDRRDLRRPDFSPSTTVVGVFIYAAADVGFVGDAVNPQTLQPLRQVLSAFGRLLGMPGAGGRNTALPVASGLTVTYPFAPERAPTTDNSAVGLAVALSALGGRSTAIVSWSLAPPPGSSEAEPSPPLPPGGWLVEVSCYSSGFYVGYLSPTPASTGHTEQPAPSGDSHYTPGIYYEGDTGLPLKIYGGVDVLTPAPELDWAGAYDGDRLRAGAAPVFFFRDLSSPEVLHKAYDRRGDRYYNQRTFYVPQQDIAAQALNGGVYHVELRRDQLPLRTPFREGELDYDRATPPTEVYVRVTAVASGLTPTTYTLLQWDLKAHRSPDETRVHVRAPYGDEARGVPSEVLAVALPDPEGDLYGSALQVALALMFLSRSDLPPPDPVTGGRAATPTSYQPTGLEAFAVEGAGLCLPDPNSYFARRGVIPDSFVTDLHQKVLHLADHYTRTRGDLPAPVLQSLRAPIQLLLEWRWETGLPSGGARVPALASTVVESLVAPRLAPGTTPLARNVYSLPDYGQGMGARTPAELLARAQETYAEETYGPGAPYDGVPVLYDSRTRRVWYVRSLIPEAVYQAARAVLALTSEASPPRNGWVMWRPLAGVSPLARTPRVLSRVEGFLRAVSQGLGGVADALLGVIDFLEQRIKELQELLLRIEDYLDLPFQVALPDLVALPLVVNGTDGLVTGLSMAANKPSDGPGAYAAGVVVVGGGMPALLTDLLLFFLGQT